jgi:Fe-S cluster assembly scaffold protein SufB
MTQDFRSQSEQFIPLSEDTRLVLDTPRRLQLEVGESKNWDEVSVLSSGERRVISVDIHVAAHAKGRMVRTFSVPKGARLTILHKVTVEAGGEWEAAVCVKGEGEVVIRRAIDLSGPAAKLALYCIARMSHLGRITVSDEAFHLAKDTESKICTKIVLDHEAKSFIRARVCVESQAEGSLVDERINQMIFGDSAAAAIPELEVKTDQVKSGHAATVSRPSEEEIFYFTSKGLTRDQAEVSLAQGFLSAGLQGLPSERGAEALHVLFG